VILRHRNIRAFQSYDSIRSPLGTPRRGVGSYAPSQVDERIPCDHMFLVQPVNFTLDVRLSRIAYDTTLVRAKLDLRVSRLRLELSSAKYQQLMSVVDANFATKTSSNQQSKPKSHATQTDVDLRNQLRHQRFTRNRAISQAGVKELDADDLSRVMRAVEAFREGYEESRRARKKKLRAARLQTVNEVGSPSRSRSTAPKDDRQQARSVHTVDNESNRDFRRPNAPKDNEGDSQSGGSSQAAVGDAMRPDAMPEFANRIRADSLFDSESVSGSHDDSTYCSVSTSSGFSTDSSEFDEALLEDRIMKTRQSISEVEQRLRTISQHGTTPAVVAVAAAKAVVVSNMKQVNSLNKPVSTTTVLDDTGAASKRVAHDQKEQEQQPPVTADELRVLLIRYKRDLSHYLRAKASNNPQRYLKRVLRWYDNPANTGQHDVSDAASLGSGFILGSDAGISAGPDSVASSVSRSTYASRRTHDSHRTFGARRGSRSGHRGRPGFSRRFGLERRQRRIRGDIRNSFQHTRQWVELALVFENIGIAILRDRAAEIERSGAQQVSGGTEQSPVGTIRRAPSVFQDPNNPVIDVIHANMVEKVATIRMRDFSFALNVYSSVAEFQASVGSLEIVDYLEVRSASSKSTCRSCFALTGYYYTTGQCGRSDHISATRARDIP